MWTSIAAIVAGLIKWVNTHFSPEAVLRRKETTAAEQKGRTDVEIERLTAIYKWIDEEKEGTPDETLAQLRKRTRRR